ncbi:kelch-like [Arthrobotrys musiformis]|uniref:Kelch-like n=1 Tax=Arthrobotrys musiformis TaxID=47236 RepID=A0AAV9VYJ7_9PEZI
MLVLTATLLAEFKLFELTFLLKRYLETPEFADVTVIVGEGAEAFELHRVILAAQSEYFSAVLKETFVEGRSRKITIPDIDSDTFRIIVKYFYTWSLGIKFEDPLDWGIVARLYQVGDYLLAPALKQKVSRCLASKIKQLYDINRGVSEPSDVDGESLYSVILDGLGSVFEHATVSDWGNIKICTDTVEKLDIDTSPDAYHQFIADGRDRTVLIAALLESYREFRF